MHICYTLQHIFKKLHFSSGMHITMILTWYQIAPSFRFFLKRQDAEASVLHVEA